MPHPDHPDPSPPPGWLMTMRWHDLLFMHWPVAVAALHRHIPERLQIDTYGGQAWIGVVPFRMSNVRPRFVPPLPWLSAFPELNVRTYVTAPGGEKPGVWFFSLDAARMLAVRAARWGFFLPYFDARMRVRSEGERIVYDSVRTHRNAPPAAFAGNYGPTGNVYRSRPGDLDHWLTERYSLYSADPQANAYRGDIHHIQWPLQPAEAQTAQNTMVDWLGITLPDTKPLLHFARRLDVVAWRLAAV